MATKTFLKAQHNKKDESFTQYDDIKNEIKYYIDYKPSVFRKKLFFYQLRTSTATYKDKTTYYGIQFKIYSSQRSSLYKCNS